jgi:hypothetical protein
MFEFTTVLVVLLIVAILCNLLVISVQISTILFILLKRQEDEKKCVHKNINKPIDTSLPADHQQALAGLASKAKTFQKLQVPDLDPFAIAPGLAKPPKAAGDFGSKTEIKHDS